MNKAHPGAYFSDDMFYATRLSQSQAKHAAIVCRSLLNNSEVSIAGDAVVGQKIEGNIPIVELIQPLAFCYTGYTSLPVGGR